MEGTADGAQKVEIDLYHQLLWIEVCLSQSFSTDVITVNDLLND